jgi:hypothetical protein
MYKLLTEEQKKNVAEEYALRRTALLLWTVISLSVIAMVGFFPSYILSQARHREVAERLQIMGDLGLSAEDQELKEWVTDFNLKQKTLSAQGESDHPAFLIEEVVAARTSGIRLTSFEWKKEEGRPVLAVAGIARDRQALVAFEASLNAHNRFGEVALPIANLARDKDIGFQVRLSPPNP